MDMKCIPNFPDYFISKDGKVFSIAKRSNRGRPIEPVLKKSWLCRGYPAVQLQKNGVHYKKYIHSLLLETFIGKCPKGYQCRHLDGNPSNNELNNLKWGTRSENQMDRLINGKDNRGEKHGMNKLSQEDVLEVFRLGRLNNTHERKKDLGGNYKFIADKFNISKSTVESIVIGRTWKWLTMPNEVEI